MYYFCPFQHIRKKAAKLPITRSGIGIEYNLSITVLFLFGKCSTTFQKVSAISCEYYYYVWVYITDFPFYLLLGIHVLIFYNTKIWNNIV